MKQCDLCRQQVEKLITLESHYSTMYIKEVCQDCKADLTDALSKYSAFWDNVKKSNKYGWYRRLIESIKK